MANTRYWKFFCMENEYPGLWKRWYQNQCVAVGCPPGWGFQLDGGKRTPQRWTIARKVLRDISIGDQIVVQLRHHKVGRIGQVVEKRIEDAQWNPLVPPNSEEKFGEMGRRVLVRWKMTIGPDNPDVIVRLPENVRLRGASVRRAISELDEAQFRRIEAAVREDENWTNLGKRFKSEASLSDYIATNPHMLEDGMQPYPYAKVREKAFVDRSRLDVLLMDRDNLPVVVECKQGSPAAKDVEQLKRYVKRLRRETQKNVRGILVHGGSQKLQSEVRAAAFGSTRIEIVQYRLEVQFSTCR